MKSGKGKFLAGLGTVLALGCVTTLPADDASATDELVHKLRQQSSESRKLVNRVGTLNTDLQALEQLMARSGVMDAKSMAQVQDVVKNVGEAGGINLQNALTNINKSITDADGRGGHIGQALEDKSAAARNLEQARQKAQQRGNRIKNQEKLNGLTRELERLMKETQEASAKELQGEEISDRMAEDLQKEQNNLANRIEELQKQFENEAKNELLDAQAEKNAEDGEKSDEQPDGEKSSENGENQESKEEMQKNADNLEEMKNAADDITKAMEDGKFKDAAEKQQDLLDKMKDMAKKMAENGKSDEQNSGDPDSQDNEASDNAELTETQQQMNELMNDVSKQNESMEEFNEKFDGEQSDMQNSEEFNDLQGNQNDLQQKAQDMAEKMDGEAKKSMEQALEKLEQAQQEMQNGNMEEAMKNNEAAQQKMEQAMQQQKQQAQQNQQQQNQQNQQQQQDQQQSQQQQQDQQQQQQQQQQESEEANDKEPNFRDQNRVAPGNMKMAVNPWSGHFNEQNKRSMMQGAEEKAPAAYEELTKSYFESLASAID